MALSGTINGTTSNSGIKSRIEWSAVQDINANTSTITAKGILYWTSNLQTWGTGTYYMSIDGVQGSNTVYAEISYNSNTVVITYTRTVSHNADGTKSLVLDFSGGISGTTLTSIDCQGTITLDTIPRASSFSIPSSVNMGSSLAVSITRASSSFTHDVKLTFNGQTVSASNVGTSATLAVPIGWASQIPNATSGTGTVTVTTKNGSTTIGTTSKNISVAVPSSVVPTLTLATALVTGYSGLYLQGVSKCKLTGTAAGVYGSTIKSISYSGAGYTGSGTTYTTGVLNVTGDITFTATATDSRGRTVTKQAKITVIAYSKPSISNYSVQRCNSGGTLQVDGTYLSVRATFSCASVNGKNAVSCNISYKKSTASAWSGTTALTSNTAKVTGGGSITLNEFWQVRFVVQDSVGTSLNLSPTTITVDIPTSAYRAVFGEDRSGFGQYPEGAGAWFAYPVHVNGGLMRTGSEYIHRANVAMGQSGYVKICTLQITTRYCDSPIEMLISQRGLGRPYTLYIQFRNSGGTDPGIESFKVTTTSGAYGATTEARLVKDAAGQWSLYLKKTEAWDDICVLDYRQDSMYNRIDVTWTDTFVGTVSGGTIAAVATDPQYLLKSGGTLTGNLTAPQFIGTLQGSAAKVNRLNQMLEESSGSDLTALMHRKVDLIRQIANGRDGVYCVHAGWSGHGWGFTIGAHYAGANVTDAVFFQGTEIDTIRLNGSTYGAVQRYMPG